MTYSNDCPALPITTPAFTNEWKYTQAPNVRSVLVVPVLPGNPAERLASTMLAYWVDPLSARAEVPCFLIVESKGELPVFVRVLPRAVPSFKVPSKYQ